MLLEQRKGGQLTFKALENLQKGDMLESATVAEDDEKRQDLFHQSPRCGQTAEGRHLESHVQCKTDGRTEREVYREDPL